MAAYNFDPWIPPSPNWRGMRLLVVGETHYDEGFKYDSAARRDYTNYVVRRYGAEAQETTTFFRRIARTFLGPTVDHQSPEFRDFWNRVCFCNYVQEFIEGRPKDHSVTKEMIKQSDAAFHEILDLVRPQAVLVMSEAVWRDMSTQNCTRAVELGGLGDVFRYTYRDGYCFAAHTHHPQSRGRNLYRPETWKPKVEAFGDFVCAEFGGKG